MLTLFFFKEKRKCLSRWLPPPIQRKFLTLQVLHRLQAAIETPAVVLELATVKHNLARIAQLSKVHGVQLRPHVKTHKSIRIARMQIAAGAVGITASKTSEALEFIRADISSVTIAYPVVDRSKIGPLLKAGIEHGVHLRLVVDSLAGVEAIAGEASLADVVVDVQLKVDVGLRRCGVDPTSPEAIRVARAIAGQPQLRFCGLLSHAGQAYRASSAEDVQEIGNTERELMLSFAQALTAAGISVPYDFSRMHAHGCSA